MESAFAANSGYFSSNEAVFATVCRSGNATANKRQNNKPTFISYRDDSKKENAKSLLPPPQNAAAVIGRSQSSREVSLRRKSSSSSQCTSWTFFLPAEEWSSFTNNSSAFSSGVLTYYSTCNLCIRFRTGCFLLKFKSSKSTNYTFFKYVVVDPKFCISSGTKGFRSYLMDWWSDEYFLLSVRTYITYNTYVVRIRATRCL